MIDADATVLAVVDLACDHFPHMARKIGRHDYDGRLPSIAPLSDADYAVLHAAVDRRLNGLDATADPELRADLDASGALLGALRFRAEALDRRYPSPLDYAYEADVSDYLAADYAPIEERVAALSRHLAGLPAHLALGEQLLGPSVPAGQRMNVIMLGPAQAAAIRETPGRLAAQRPDLAETVAPLAEAAAAAYQSFIRA